MNFVNIYFKLFLYLSFFNIIFPYIKLPIYTFHSSPPNKSTEEEYVTYFSENNIYTYLETGSPSQKIVARLNFNDFQFRIYYNRCEILSNFDLNISKTYDIEPFGMLFSDVYVYTYLVNDTFIFNENKNNPKILTYLFSPDKDQSGSKLPQLPYTCADIGLKYPRPDLRSYNYNFFRELHLAKLTENNIFFIEYDDKNKDEGYLILGVEPYEYNPNKYKYKKSKSISAIQNTNDLYWQLRFNSIYFTKKENGTQYFNLTEVDADLNNDLNVILATYEYMEIIEKQFFKEKIKNKLCTKNILKSNYYNYECTSYKDVQEFPTLYFFHRNLGYTYELNYKDLFIEFQGKYISLIWIDMTYRKAWYLGNPFLKKYMFSFNAENKIIGFCNMDTQEEEEKKNENNYIYVYIIIIIGLLILVAVLGFFLAKAIYKKRKRKNKIHIDELIEESGRIN